VVNTKLLLKSLDQVVGEYPIDQSFPLYLSRTVARILYFMVDPLWVKQCTKKKSCVLACILRLISSYKQVSLISK